MVRRATLYILEIGPRLLLLRPLVNKLALVLRVINLYRSDGFSHFRQSLLLDYDMWRWRRWLATDDLVNRLGSSLGIGKDLGEKLVNCLFRVGLMATR